MKVMKLSVVCSTIELARYAANSFLRGFKASRPPYLEFAPVVFAIYGNLMPESQRNRFYLFIGVVATRFQQQTGDTAALRKIVNIWQLIQNGEERVVSMFLLGNTMFSQ